MRIRSTRQAAWIAGAALAVLTVAPDRAAAQVAGGSVSLSGQQQTRETEKRVGATVGLQFVDVIDIPTQLDETKPPPNADKKEFELNDVEVTGSSVYSKADFAPILKDYLKRRVTLAEIYKLAAALVRKYHDDGYTFIKVAVPGQHVTDGEVKLQVTEYKVSTVEFMLDGKPVAMPAVMKPSIDAILGTHPLTVKLVDRIVEAAATLPNLRVAVTRPILLSHGLVDFVVTFIRPGDPAVILPPGPEPLQPPANADQIAFPLKSLQITGVTAFTPDDLASFYKPLIGHQVTLRQLYDLAAAITKRYAAAGYFGCLAVVPPQVVHDGAVTIEVHELVIDKVNLSIDRQNVAPGSLLGNILDRVTEQKPVTTRLIGRQLFVAQQIPGITVESIIPPAAGNPSADVYLKRKPYSVNAVIDNRGSAPVGPTEITMSAKEDGQLGLNEELQIIAAESFPLKELNLGGVAAIVPLSSTGLLFNASYNHTEAYPGGVVTPLGIVSKGDTASVGLAYPIFGTATSSLIESFSYDMTNSRAFITNGVTTTSDDRTRALRLGSQFTYLDGLGGNITGNVVIGQGIDVMGARPHGTQPNSRPGSTLEFTKVRFDFLRQQPLPQSFALQLGLSGQRAFSPLPSAELYSFGGALYGRAYDPGIIAGDHGIAVKAELSRAVPVGLPLLPLLQPFVFYDFGATEYAIPVPGLQKRATAASAGVGTRFIILPWLGGLVEFDRALTRQTVDLSGQRAKDTRVFFSLAAQY